MGEETRSAYAKLRLTGERLRRHAAELDRVDALRRGVTRRRGAGAAGPPGHAPPEATARRGISCTPAKD